MMRRIAYLLALVLVLASPMAALASSSRLAPPADTADDLLSQMTAEERIGQLFLVTFKGSSAEGGSAIDTLIREHHVAGVVLLAENDNFGAAPNTAVSLRQLVQRLQEIEYQNSLGQSILDSVTNQQKAPTYVPLLIAVSDELGGIPISRFVDGMSSLPNEMAIGATWDPSLAEDAGRALGQELKSLGVNMYMGPSLDVLEEPGQAGPGDLGSRTFGGDPYWVSQMGSAFVRGLHEGAAGGLAVIAKHFPGHGGSDRPLAEEVATVRKSIDQLLQIELPPFFAVTGNAPGESASAVDGLLVSHIRYQGFQGNIRATTRPISLDPEAYRQLMSLDPIQTWREQGGLTVSDSLGSRAIRRFRDPLEQSFQPQLVARDALVAGNDLLFAGNIKGPNDPDELSAVESTLAFFTQKYREDSVFAQRVDEAVLRILRMKLRMYDGAFVETRVVPRPTAREVLGTNEGIAFAVLRRAATLVSPTAEELDSRLGGSPDLSERVVFFTDVQPVSRCSNCDAVPAMAVDSLERRVNGLYGPGAAGQVGTWNLWSFSEADLASYLGEAPPSPQPFPLSSPDVLDEPLRTADWLVFSITDVNSERYGANALQLLLDERPDLVRNKKVVVFGFDVPYGLDATDLSKIGAFYNLYAASDPAIDVAARLLFEELTAPGAPPVSVPGIGYDLITALQPAADQLMSLSIEGVVGEGTPTADVDTGFTQGSVIRIGTDIIRDSNGHPVPDDTPVEFVISQPENIQQTVAAVTHDGVSEITYRLERLGLFIIQARSDPALRSDVLQLDVQEGVPAFPTVIAPTELPTETFVPTETPGLLTATPESIGEETEEPGPAQGPNARDLLFGLLGVGMVAGGSYMYLGRTERWLGSSMRCGLVAAVGGLAGYNYLALNLPGTNALMETLGSFAGWLIAVLGGMAGLGLYALSLNLRRQDLEDGSQGSNDSEKDGG
ncbi:MAG: glycoside hydrolase family 3 N-terminal domain-containing protein [Anaerolineales bacterium]